MKESYYLRIKSGNEDIEEISIDKGHLLVKNLKKLALFSRDHKLDCFTNYFSEVGGEFSEEKWFTPKIAVPKLKKLADELGEKSNTITNTNDVQNALLFVIKKLASSEPDIIFHLSTRWE